MVKSGYHAVHERTRAKPTTEGERCRTGEYIIPFDKMPAYYLTSALLPAPDRSIGAEVMYVEAPWGSFVNSWVGTRPRLLVRRPRATPDRSF